MKSFFNDDKKNIFFLAAFCVFFFILRIIQPHSLMNDEAEQILNSENFVLGFPKQPPLYSWILWSINLIFGYLNLEILSAVKYLIYFGFLLTVYKISRLLFSPKIAFLVCCSEILFITYSYDFTRDLTHSILVTFISTLLVHQYFITIIKPNFLNYFFLGVLLGLGFLSKYSFVFIVLSILFTSLIFKRSRKILFDFKSIISISIGGLIFSPNLFYLYKNNLSGLNYALERGLGDEKIFHFGVLLRTLGLAFYEIVIVLLVLLLIFNSFLDKSNVFFSKKSFFKKNLVFMALISIFLAAVIILFFNFQNFYPKWLSSSMFLIPLAFFTFTNLDQIKNFSLSDLLLLKKSFKLLSLAVVFIVFLITIVNLIGAFMPDLIGKVKKTQYPYNSITQSIIDELSLNLSAPNFLIIIKNDFVLEANFKLAFENINPEIKVLNLKSFLEESLNADEPKNLIFISKKKFKNEDLGDLKVTEKKRKFLKELYINSKNQYFKIYLLVCKTPKA